MLEVTVRFVGYIMLTGIVLVIIGWLWGIFKTRIFVPLGDYINGTQYYSTYQSILYKSDKAIEYTGAILLFGGFVWYILNVLKTRYEQV
jgi:hypothetical protein